MLNGRWLLANRPFSRGQKFETFSCSLRPPHTPGSMMRGRPRGVATHRINGIPTSLNRGCGDAWKVEMCASKKSFKLLARVDRNQHKSFKNFLKMFEIERLSVHCIYLCKRWALILEKNATHYWAMCPFLLYLSEVNMRPEVLWNVKFCAIHFAKLLTRFPFSEQVHCQSKHPVEQALPSIYDSAGGRFPRQASNFVKQSSNSNMKHHEENVLSSKPNFVKKSRKIDFFLG